jgi:hemerythrin
MSEVRNSGKILIIEDQHDVLRANITRLEGAMTIGQGALMAPKTLTDLEEYANYHFGTEERLMRSYKYPLRDTHTAQHLVFRGHLTSLANLVAKEDKTSAVEIIHVLRRWLSNHVEGDDAILDAFLQSKGLT